MRGGGGESEILGNPETTGFPGTHIRIYKYDFVRYRVIRESLKVLVVTRSSKSETQRLIHRRSLPLGREVEGTGGKRKMRVGMSGGDGNELIVKN